MDMGDLRGLATIFCMLAFAAVVYWAYGPSRKADFEEAGNILFAEPEPGISPSAMKGSDKEGSK